MPGLFFRLKKIIKWLFILGLFCAVLGVGAIAYLYYKLVPELPPVEALRNVSLQVPLRIYTSEKKLIATFGEKRRIPLAIDETPLDLKNAFIAIEDDDFYSHNGVSLKGLMRAAYNLIKTGQKGQGGSTITMQVARNFFLTFEKTYLRKLNEIFLAIKIEQAFSKDNILELYLNKIYLGNRAYGIGAAAKIYYGKSVDALTLAEMAMIAGLPKAPSKYNPIVNPERALIRRDYILMRMHLLEMITEDDYRRAVSEPVSAFLRKIEPDVEAGYVAEMVRADVVAQFGDKAYTSGLNVYTSLVAKKQRAANQALRKALIAYEKRNGYRGPAGSVDESVLISTEKMLEALKAYPAYGELLPAIVVDVTETGVSVFLPSAEIHEIKRANLIWAGKNRDKTTNATEAILANGDVIYTSPMVDGSLELTQIPVIEGGLVSLSSRDGAIQALVGGFDFSRSKFNRVTQARRQPGSGFKPFIYSAALENGNTAATIFNDAPIVLKDSALEGDWRPENYSGKFYGPTRLREGLVKSRNLISIRVLMSLGLKKAINYASRFGFEKKSMPRNLSLALGSGAVSPLQMATAYSIFSNGGYQVAPYWINRIEGNNGQIIFDNRPLTVCPDCEGKAGKQPASIVEETESLLMPIANRVVDERNVYIVRSMLGDVIKRGTGRQALALKRGDLAGKTGTTNDQKDAWFNGFNDEVATSVWVGYDDHQPLGPRETGARAALPMWIDYMRVALDGTADIKKQLPDGMTVVRINEKTGQALAPGEVGGRFETFRSEHAPKTQHQNSGPIGRPAKQPERLF